MKCFVMTVTSLAIATLALFASPSPASATQLNLCNQTSAHLEVAVGYYSAGRGQTSTHLSGPFVSTGWWDLSAGQCRNFANPFNARYMFWWGAQRIGINSSGSMWNTNGIDHFCIPNFHGPAAEISAYWTFVRKNESKAACESSSSNPAIGHNLWVAARKVDLLASPTVNFTGQ